MADRVPVRIAIYGSGWRSEFFLRIAHLLPDEFTITSIWTKDPEKLATLTARLGVRATSHVDSAATTDSPEFAIVCLPPTVAPRLLRHLAGLGIPVLTETPPASNEADVTSLLELEGRGSVFQVAEQYQFQPMHVARLELIRQGVIGEPSFAELSVAHGYHGVSLLRLYLGIRAADTVNVDARAYRNTLLGGGTRDAPPSSQLITSRRTSAHLESKGKTGMYLFDDDQYFSLVRPPRTVVEGTKGTIVNSLVTYVGRDGRQRSSSIVKEGSGGESNLRGNALEHISFEGRSLFINPHPSLSMSDEEIAIVSVMSRMADFVRGTGAGPYELTQAITDYRISERIESGARAHEARNAAQEDSTMSRSE